MIKKVKNIVPWTYAINDRNGEDFVGTFYKNELQKKQIKKSLELKMLSKEKTMNYMLNGKDKKIRLIAG